MEHHHLSYHKVSRETFASVDARIQTIRPQLNAYLDQLLWWNQRLNLISRDVSRETVADHIRHSLLLTQFELFSDAESVVDTGTGGGLPGIPLAIFAPEKTFILNDIVSRKVVAVRQMVQKLGLKNVELSDGSIEKLDIPSSSLLVSKHAFKVNELWEMVNGKPWQAMVYYKGADFEDELEGIDEPLTIECFDLSKGSLFYQGKALIFVHRQDA